MPIPSRTALLARLSAQPFDLLIIGHHGHSAILERVMGSTAQSLVRLAPCSVLLAK